MKVRERSPLPLAIANLMAFLAVVVVNTLAVTLPLGGMTTGQLSDRYPNLFVPAGVTFSIWGLIYLLLAGYVVTGVISAAGRRPPGSNHVETVGLRFVLSCAANLGWIFSWQYRVVPLSMVCMLLLLVSLLSMYRRLGVGRSRARCSEKYLVHLPVSIYLGWITIATLANLTALLVHWRVSALIVGGEAWAMILMGLGVALGLAVLFNRTDIYYALVVDWAVLGILLKRTAASVPAPAVVAAAIVGICLLSLAVVVQVLRGRVYRSPS